VDFNHAALIGSALPAVTGPARWTPMEDGRVQQFFRGQTGFDGYDTRVE
jgi:hypothetical protein